jgi:hypothetical protein
VLIKVKIKILQPMKTVTLSLPNNWKTTLVGIVSAVAAVVEASSYWPNNWLAAFHDHSVQAKIILAVLAFLAKDFDNESTPPAVAPKA